ncbi:MAG: hypothetical protein A3F72_05055 [Bacteroidetes bacterium RIFCSPLOWO2_12_FULL_35_15]|nr:MAG: hypothetical protein A3F72_05055 [Bacteroidetes bacterium RIFCSPLOWO2_12_FULL_35_15]
MSYLNKIKSFSFTNKIRIFKYSFGSILADSIPKGLKHTYHLLQEMKSKGIVINKKRDFVEFTDPGTNFLISLEQNSSDSMVYQQIFLHEEYHAVLDVIAKHNLSIKTMIDAGANVGFTILYFKNQFKDLNIIGLEPSPSTFKKLTRNITNNNLTNVILHKKGLWSKTTRLKAERSFRDGEDWSFRIVEANDNEIADIETFSIQDLIEIHQLKQIDFLKIDVEGAEKNIFENLNFLNWLPKICLLAIEIHDEFDCRTHIENHLSNNGFELSYSGELTIAINKNLIHTSNKFI